MGRWFCSRWGSEIQTRPPTEQVPTTSCPVCGHESWTERVEGDVLVYDEQAAVLQRREGRSMAFSESARPNGVAVSAELTGGAVEFQARGPAPKNEDDTLSTCDRLVAKLRADGEDWAEPEEGSEEVDCQCTAAQGGHGYLKIQVVRATVDSAIWRELSLKKELARSIDKAQAISDLHAAIAKKAEKIPPAQRRTLVLALDANRLPGHAFDDVIDGFTAEHGAWLRRLGFSRTFVVGPTVALVRQLDGVKDD
jgi:hypothetical protein